MRALLYKDLISLKKPLIILLIVLGLISFYFYTEDQIHLLPLFFILLPVIIIGMLFGSDAQAQIDKYLVPSPVKRSTIVLSRYVIIWVLAAIATILALAMPLLTEENPLYLPWYLMAPGMFLLASFISVIQLPLIYRFSESNARLIFFILYFVAVAFFSSIASNKEWLVSRLQSGFGFNRLYISVDLTIVTILVNGISYLVSRLIYQNKDF